MLKYMEIQHAEARASSPVCMAHPLPVSWFASLSHMSLHRNRGGIAKSPHRPSGLARFLHWPPQKNHPSFLTDWETLDKREVANFKKHPLGDVHDSLVGGLEHVCPFHIWDIILPIDELIFFRGVGLNHQPDIIYY